MNLPLRLRQLLSTALLLTGASLLPGQETPPPAAAASSAAPVQPKSPSISFDFRGGSLAQLVTQVGKTEGRSFNLISTYHSPFTSLPAFSIRNADPIAFTRALNLLLEKNNLQVDLIKSETAGTEPVAVITVKKKDAATGSATPAAAEDEFDSFQLKPYLLGQSVDDIVGAIRAAWELDPAHDAKAVRLKYNQATKLLLVSGPPEAVAIARKVIAHLSTDSKFMQFRPQDSTESNK